MKKILFGVLIVFSLSLAGCSNNEDSTTTKLKEQITELKKEISDLKEQKTISTDIQKSDESSKAYKEGDYWEVKDQWKLTVNKVFATDERNQFSDKTPEQVIIIDYTYENLGYKNDNQDLFINPKSVIDDSEQMAHTYPVHTNLSPQPTPVGSTMAEAQVGYGLDNSSNTVEIYFSKADNNGKIQTATFKVEVE